MDEAVLADTVAAALTAGADAAEAVFAERQALSVSVRLGALEEVEREELRDLGVRVFVGARQASVSGSDISAAGRAKLIERVVAMARLAPEDPYAAWPLKIGWRARKARTCPCSTRPRPTPRPSRPAPRSPRTPPGRWPG